MPLYLEETKVLFAFVCSRKFLQQRLQKHKLKGPVASNKKHYCRSSKKRPLRDYN